MGRKRTSERVKLRRRAIFEAAQEKAMKASLKEYAEVFDAITKAQGRLRAIMAKRAMYALDLYVLRKKPWREAKALAAGKFSPGYEGHEEKK